MKTLTIAVILFFTLIQISYAKRRDFYQIQIYRLTGKTQEQSVDKFLKTCYLPALHRAGIKTVGVFKPVTSDTTCGKQIIVWLPLRSPGEIDKLQKILSNDATYQTEGAEFLKAPFDQVPYQRKESTLLKVFDFC